MKNLTTSQKINMAHIYCDPCERIETELRRLQLAAEEGNVPPESAKKIIRAEMHNMKRQLVEATEHFGVNEYTEAMAKDCITLFPRWESWMADSSLMIPRQ